MANIDLKDIFVKTFNKDNVFSYKDTCVMCVKYDGNGNYDLSTAYIGPGVLSAISNKRHKWDDAANASSMDPEIKVCIRKAIPAHPRRGMYYYFDNGIRFNMIDYIDTESSSGFTVPSSGEYIAFDREKREIAVPNNTKITYSNKSTYFQDEWRPGLLIKKTNGPVLVKILKDMACPLDDGAISITELKAKDTITPPSFTGRNNYIDVVNGVVTYRLKNTVPFKCKDAVSANEANKTKRSGYKIFRRAVPHGTRRYFDTETKTYKNCKDYNKDSKRLLGVHTRPLKYGCYYLRRYKIIKHNKILYGPICKCRVDENGIITRIYDNLVS